MKITKILIAIDDNKFSENASAYGFDLAQLSGAEVGLVHIVEPIVFPTGSSDALTATPFEGTAIADPELIRAQTASSENIIEKTINKFAGDIKVTHFTEYGSASDGILSCSKEFGADLIVLGTHSRSGFERLLMGSTAEHVVRHSEVPVLVVPLREEE